MPAWNRLANERKITMFQEINMILFGKANIGKTTTLMKLAMLLAGNGTITPAIESSVIDHFGVKRKGVVKRFKDAHLIVKYKEKLIFIATGGDSWFVSRNNYDFFTGNYNNLTDVFFVDITGVKCLKNSEKEEFKIQKPCLSICACRPSGDNYGAIKAIHSYSVDCLGRFAQQIWIQKKDNKNVSERDSEVKEILQTIDALLGL